MDTAGEGEGGTNWETGIETYTRQCVKQLASGKLLRNTRNSTWCPVTMKRGGLEWGVGGRFKKKTYVYLWLICTAVWQKSAQHCKAIILWLQIIFFLIYVNKTSLWSADMSGKKIRRKNPFWWFKQCCCSSNNYLSNVVRHKMMTQETNSNKIQFGPDTIDSQARLSSEFSLRASGQVQSNTCMEQNFFL